MSFESTVYSTLANDATLGLICPQMYPQQPIDNIRFPFLWYSFQRQDYLVFGHVATAISNYTFEISCFAKTQASVKQIADRIITLLDGLSLPPDVGSLVLSDQSQKLRSDGYIYFVKSLRFTGLGV